jgi:hypothetical protein
MAIVPFDWSVDRQTGNVRYIGEDHEGGSIITTGAFSVGTFYRIHVAGDTDFTLIGAADSDVGTEFVATGVGGGTTGTALEAGSYATVIQLHRWLGDLADNGTSSGDDELDMTDVLPSSRATDNLITFLGDYNIDDVAAEHLYDGSIIQGTGGTEVYYDGIVNFGNQGVVIQLHKNGIVVADDWWNWGIGGTDDTSTAAAFLTDSTAVFTASEFVGYIIKNVTDGSQALITANTTTTITGVLFGGTNNDWDSGDAYLISQGLNRDTAQGVSHRFLVKTRDAGADVDGRRLLGINRTYGKTYGEFKINGTARGNNVLALSDAADLNNATARATIDAYADVFIDRTVTTATVNGVNAVGQAVLNVSDGTQFSDGDFIMTAVDNQEYKIMSIATNALTLNRNLITATVGAEATYVLNIGFTQIDVDNNTVNEDYYAHWDRGAATINQFFEYTKNLSADATNHYVYGIPGELFRGITHEFDVDTPTGTFDLVESVAWTAGTGGAIGTGQMLSVDSPTAGTKMWVQLLTGGAPGDNGVITGGNSGATLTVATTVTDRSSLITSPFVGASTGSAIIGSYGLTLQTTDLSATDKVFDLTNTQITPPNNVTFSVNGPVVGEDYILVGPWDGTSTDINGDPSFYKEWTLNGALTTANVTSVVINEAIPVGTPADGYIQVIDDAKQTRRLHYTSWVTSTFTVDTATGDEDFDVTGAADGNRTIQSQLMLDTALTANGITAVVCSENIPSDTPTPGFIRVQDDAGFLRRLSYSGFTGATFTIDEASGQEDFLGNEAAIGSNIFIAYIDLLTTADPEEFSYVYSGSDRKHVIRVRDGGASPIKEYITSGTMGTNGGSTSVIRTTDA